MFKDFLNKIGYFHEHPITRARHHDMKKSFDSPKKNMEERKSSTDYREELDAIIDDPDQLKSLWKNQMLIIIPTRLGLNKINKEYFPAILRFF